ncbi:Peptidase M28 [Sphingomonas antarctica]|uniref:M28 family metallopeptidase n=1 Tax=Sphingomonas antarctica TaxID=2040274 RepID=UPI0039E9B105
MRLTLALIAVLATGARAADAPPQIPVQTLKDVTQTLSSDAFEGRAPTSAAEPKVIAYMTQRFKAAGLQPGNHGKWTQDVPMVRVTADPAMVAHFSGGNAPVDLAYKTDIALFSYREVPQTTIANSDVVFVGYGIVAPEKGWNDYAGIDVRGKTVVILVNDPDWKTPTVGACGVEPAPQVQASSGGRCDPTRFNGRAMTYYGRWTYKYEEAARQGAAAAIIVHDTEPAAYGWGVVVSSYTGSQIHLAAANKSMRETQANGWMTQDAAKRLFAASGKDLSALALAAEKPGFKAVPLGLKMNLNFANKLEYSMSHNIVGILPGTTKPGEYVLYSAHWDHLGRCTPVKGDDICNGALDNASGSAGLVALAEVAAKAPRTPRSQVFLSVTAEESGLLGSRFYAEHPIYPLGKTVGGVNMDGLNVMGLTKDVSVVGPGKSDLDDYVARYAALQGRRITPESNPERGGYYRSDHFSFAKLGVPMLDAGAGEDLVDGGTAKGHALNEDYNVNRYHKPQDEYDPNWNWDGAVQDLQFYYGIGHELATTDAWPNWKAGDEFRAIRDKSRADAK